MHLDMQASEEAGVTSGVTYVAQLETYHVDVLDVVDHAVVVRFKLLSVEGQTCEREIGQRATC